MKSPEINTLSAALAAEELARWEAGVATLLASHSLAQTAVALSGNTALMDQLVQHGANVNAQVTGTKTYSLRVSRAPSANERRAAENAVEDPARPGRPSAEGLADLLWAVLMKPEFQLIY